MFNRWVEAVPSKNLSVDTVIKLLTQLNCEDTLPLALMSYHMQANRMTHLTSHEMLTGRPMSSLNIRGSQKGLPFN